MRRTPVNGFSLLELITVATIGLTLLLLGYPMLVRGSSRYRVRLAAEEIATAMRLAQSYAIRHDAYVGVKFEISPSGVVTYALYRDGNHDGIGSDDIRSGRDPQVVPPQVLSSLGAGVGFGFPPGPAPKDPGNPHQRLDHLADPIRFNRSDIASFSPIGESTPGSVYLTDHVRNLFVVRVFGRTARVRILAYDLEAETWSE